MAETAVEVPRVLRGKGVDLGPYATRFPLEERTILNLMRAQAATYGDKPWLIFDRKDTLTFAEAERLTFQVAHAIRDSIGPHKNVALYLRNQYEFLPVEMGAMAAPGLAVPLNAEARGPLLLSQIERADVELVVARTDQLELLARLDNLAQIKLVVAAGEGDVPQEISGVPVVRFEDWIAGKPAAPPTEELPKHDDMCAIAFTSGTTGKAKGVFHTHHYWYMFSAVIADSQRHTEDDIMTSPLPIYHGGALHLIANGSLHCGCTAHLQSRFSPKRFWPDAAEDKATYAFLLGPLAAMVSKETPDPVPEHRVKFIYCVPAPPEKKAWEERFSTKIHSQAWAMTEIFACPAVPEQLENVPDDTIGHPMAVWEYGVLDGNDNMVPPGEIGEMAWRPLVPHMMFSGYYKEPEITLDAFRNFWFHTGDAATYDEDGVLYFKGRIRDRLRRRGEMISAGELEYVALLHDKVLEAAVYGVKSNLGEDDIKLDCVLMEGAQLEYGEFHAWLSENLPRFMIPRYVEFRAEFPKTPSLRIEKYKLSQEAIDRPEVFDAGDRTGSRKK